MSGRTHPRAALCADRQPLDGKHFSVENEKQNRPEAIWGKHREVVKVGKREDPKAVSFSRAPVLLDAEGAPSGSLQGHSVSGRPVEDEGS